MKKILLFLFLLISVSVSAQTAEDSLTLVNCHWEKSHISRGITARHATFEHLYGGAQDVYIIEVSQHHQLAAIDHNGRALTSEEAQKQQARAAINGTYFDINGDGRSICLTAHNGRVTDYTRKPLGTLSNGAVRLVGRTVDIVPWDVNMEREAYRDSVGQGRYADGDIMVSGPLLLQHGRSVTFVDESHVMGKHPRSAIATNDRKVYLVVVDGRRAGTAIGVTIPELSHMLRIMKMDAALNLDGGGSSVLWTGGKKAIGILNHPSDGKERPVSNSICVY